MFQALSSHESAIDPLRTDARVPAGRVVRLRGFPEGYARMAGEAAPDPGKGKKQYRPGAGSGEAEGTNPPPGHRSRTTRTGDPQTPEAGASRREGLHHRRVRKGPREETGGEIDGQAHHGEHRGGRAWFFGGTPGGFSGRGTGGVDRGRGDRRDCSAIRSGHAWQISRVT